MKGSVQRIIEKITRIVRALNLAVRGTRIFSGFLLKERRLILCAARLTESRHFSNVGRGRKFRSKIYLPVITPWHWRFPGVSRPVTVRVRAHVSLSSAFFLCTPSATLWERGRVRIIMALRVLTLHLLSQLVIHISPHVSLPSPMPSLIFFSSDTSVPDISYIRDSEFVQYLQNPGRERVLREHHRKIELEMARPNKMSATAIASVQRNSVKL